MNIFGDLSREQFLKKYWQKKPLLIRQAFPDYQSPISSQELAGLACEDSVESRLIQEKGGIKPWQLRHGPFIVNDFTSLPESHWTLLVQSVDHHVPGVAAILDKFDFIPNWRIDDVMISFAQEHGSVGPHFDNYDVFLLQVEGRRHWYINENDYSENDLLKKTDLRILSRFESEQDWILEPGDMLYLPPGVAHHGIALDDCLTFSIGFRAPTQSELLYAYTEELPDSGEDIFYTDPDLSLQKSPGEINKDHIQAIKELMKLSNIDDSEFSSWFGRFITEKKDQLEYESEALTKDEFVKQFPKQGKVMRNGYIRLSYVDNNDLVSLFIAGEEFELSLSYLSLVQYLCASHEINYEKVIECCDESAALDLLFKLFDDGYFFFDE